MKLKKIRLKNIRSYENEEIEFPNGSILISGEVGSGKSSLLLAVEYALFGLQPGQKGSSLLRNSCNSGEVYLELEVSGKIIEIERVLKRTPRGVSNDSASITIDGEKFESSVTEIKSKIVGILGYPSEFVKKNNILYRYTVHTPQEQMKQIVLEEPETRIDVLRHIFGMDKYKQIKENLAILLANLRSKSKLLQAEIKSLDQDKFNIQEKNEKIIFLKQKREEKILELEMKKLSLNKLQSELNDLKKKTDEKIILESELDKTKIMIASKRDILSSINRENEELRSSLKEASESFNKESYLSILKSIEIKKSALDSLNSNFLNIASKLNSLIQEEKSLSEKKDRVFRIDICPTCLQDVPEMHKHNILNETESRLSEIKKESFVLAENKREIISQIEEIKTQINSLEKTKLSLEILKSRLSQVEKMRLKSSELEKRKDLFLKDIELLTEHFLGLKEKILKHSAFEFQHRKKEEEVRNALFEEKSVEIELAEMSKEIQLLEAEITFLESIVLGKEKLKAKMLGTEEMIEWLSNSFLSLIDLIERNLLVKLRKDFSQLFRKWFLMLITDSSLESHVDDNFTPLIIQGETEMDYSFLSGGERTAVALAYRLALNQTINSFLSKIKTKGIIILDEPTDGFSETQIEKIRDILSELNAEQLILVSHEQKVEGFVDNIIRVSKEGSTSSVQAVFQENYQKT